jgi:hypothetical protein
MFFNDLATEHIMGQKVQCQILTGRTDPAGGVVGSQVGEVFVEDEGVDKEILDDGGGPHKKMGESFPSLTLPLPPASLLPIPSSRVHVLGKNTL